MKNSVLMRSINTLYFRQNNSLIPIEINKRSTEKQLNVIPLEEKIERRQLSWLGHITKMDDNRTVKGGKRQEKKKKASYTNVEFHN
jgi:hypothetical protein